MTTDPARPIALLVGLGNPGAQYALTRHNAGRWFIERLQRLYPIAFKFEKKFKGETASFMFEQRTVRVLVPDTFMNLCGQSVAPMAAFHRIPAAQLLIIHDELALPPGTARLKHGGGHGGHNGLRDITRCLGSADYHRLRLGIGHPGRERDVSGYVLSRCDPAQRVQIEAALDRAAAVLPAVLSGNFQPAMNKLHLPEAAAQSRSAAPGHP